MIGDGVPDPRKMIRDCFKLNLLDPRTSTYGAICAQIIVTDQEIKHLSRDAPDLRRQHLLELIETAKNEDGARAKAITDILKREAQKKQWNQINYTTPSPQRGNPLAIQVMTSTGIELHNTKDLVILHANAHLSINSCLVYKAPCYSNQLLHDIGHIGDTQCILDVLEGTYTSPPNTDRWTRMILEEAHHSYVLLAKEEIQTTILVCNYQD
jgi:hypothetical protein